jgi:hypothetical protein
VLPGCTSDYTKVVPNLTPASSLTLKAITDLERSDSVCLRCYTNSVTVPFFDASFTYKVTNKCITDRISFGPIISPYLHYVNEGGTLIAEAKTTSNVLCPLTGVGSVELVDATTGLAIPNAISTIVGG